MLKTELSMKLVSSGRESVKELVGCHLIVVTDIVIIFKIVTSAIQVDIYVCYRRDLFTLTLCQSRSLDKGRGRGTDSDCH